MTKNNKLIEGFPNGEIRFIKGKDGAERLVVVGLEEGLLMTTETYKECQDKLMQGDTLRLLLFYEPPQPSSD